MKMMSIKKIHIYIFLIVIIGIIIRLWNFNHIGLAYDEASFSIFAKNLMKNPLDIESHPFSLYMHVTSIFFSIFGTSDFVARMVSLLFGTSTIIIIYIVGRDFFGKDVGLLSAAMMSINPYLILLNRLALQDTLLVLLFLLSIYFLFKIEDSILWSVCLGFTLGIMQITKQAAFILIFSIIISGIIIYACGYRHEYKYGYRHKYKYGDTYKKKLMSILTSISSIIAGFLFVIIPWIIILDPVNLYEYVIWQRSRVGELSNNILFYVDIFREYLSVPFILLSFIGIIYFVTRCFYKDENRRNILICTILVTIPFSYFILISLKQWHYLAPIIPLLIIIVSKLLYDVVSPKESYMKKLIFFVVCIVLFIGMSISTYDNIIYNDYKQNVLKSAGVREAAFWIKENVPSGTGVLVNNPRTARVFEFYIGDEYKIYDFTESVNSWERISKRKNIFEIERLIRNGTITYIVTDNYSSHTQKFSDMVNIYIREFDGKLIDTIYWDVYTRDIGSETTPRVWIYRLDNNILDNI